MLQFTNKKLIYKMMGFCESTVQQKAGNPRVILPACNRYAGFAYPALLAECGYEPFFTKAASSAFARANSGYSRLSVFRQAILPHPERLIGEVVSEPALP